VKVPCSLDTPEVRAALQEWLDYKRDKGKPYKRPSHLAKKLVDFESAGPQAFVAAVNHSIGNNYDGLFLPSVGNGHAPRNGKPSVGETVQRLMAEAERLEALGQ
jgi:hypothetical protein